MRDRASRSNPLRQRMHLEGGTFLIMTVSYRERSMPVYGSSLTSEGLGAHVEQDWFTLGFVPSTKLLVIDVGHLYIQHQSYNR